MHNRYRVYVVCWCSTTGYIHSKKSTKDKVQLISTAFSADNFQGLTLPDILNAVVEKLWVSSLYFRDLSNNIIITVPDVENMLAALDTTNASGEFVLPTSTVNAAIAAAGAMDVGFVTGAGTASVTGTGAAGGFSGASVFAAGGSGGSNSAAANSRKMIGNSRSAATIAAATAATAEADEDSDSDGPGLGMGGIFGGRAGNGNGHGHDSASSSSSGLRKSRLMGVSREDESPLTTGTGLLYAGSVPIPGPGRGPSTASAAAFDRNVKRRYPSQTQTQTQTPIQTPTQNLANPNLVYPQQHPLLNPGQLTHPHPLYPPHSAAVGTGGYYYNIQPPYSLGDSRIVMGSGGTAPGLGPGPGLGLGLGSNITADYTNFTLNYYSGGPQLRDERSQSHAHSYGGRESGHGHGLGHGLYPNGAGFGADGNGSGGAGGGGVPALGSSHRQAVGVNVGVGTSAGPPRLPAASMHSQVPRSQFQLPEDVSHSISSNFRASGLYRVEDKFERR
jgi:hypothetical protein